MSRKIQKTVYFKLGVSFYLQQIINGMTQFFLKASLTKPIKLQTEIQAVDLGLLMDIPVCTGNRLSAYSKVGILI